MQPGEDPVVALARVAKALSFAFFIDPEEARGQPAFDIASDSIVLPDGVVTRAQLRGAYSLVRDQARVAASGADQLFVFFVEHGGLDVHPTREGTPVRVGDILIVDLARAVTLQQTGHTYTLFVIARGMLPAEVRHRDLHCRIIRSGHPLAGIVSCMAHRLSADSRVMTPAQAMLVLGSTVALLGTALEDIAPAGRTVLPTKAIVEAVVDTNLERTDLTPTWIADRLGISRATLYRAFEPYGGVKTFVADRRMQRAWTLVSSPNGPAFAEIAKACGFSTTRRFDKAFSERFGVAPAAGRSASGEDRRLLDEAAAQQMVGSWDKRIGDR